MALKGLWYISIFLSAISLAIMACLILARFIAERRARKIQQGRTGLTALLLDPGSSPSAAMANKSPALLADLAVELIQLVRGEERDELVAAATRLGVGASLRRRLRARAARTRVSAAESLTHFPDPETTRSLERALADRSPDVRLAAALSLASSGRATDARMLVDRLGLGTSEQSLLMVDLFQKIAAVRTGEVEALIGDPAMPGPVKAAAIDALAATGDFRLVPAINALALAADPMSEHLPRYLRALGTLGHPGGGPAVRQALTGPAWWARAAAAEAAGRIGLQDLVPALGQLLGDPDWWVRFRAGEALVRLGQPGVDLLSKAVRDASEPARSAAKLTLAEQGIAA